MDRVVIRDLVVYAHHGVFAEEKALGQKFILHLELFASLQEAGLTGDLAKSIHYGELAQEVSRLFQEESLDLIESAAEQVAHFILSRYPLVEEVRVDLVKPWAPIGREAEARVVLERKRHRAFIGLGSNIEPRADYLARARQALESSYCTIKKASSLYETPAWGLEDQGDFLNQVVEIETFYEARELLRFLQDIETRLGRTRDIHWGPRTIDLDILFYDDARIYEEDLVVPHPYVEKRAFVLEPLQEIAPFLIHPVKNQSILDLYEQLKNKPKD